MSVLYVHGWGSAPQFWDQLNTGLNKNKTNRIDLNFCDSGQTTEDINHQNTIVITHSLGTLWALKNLKQKIEKFIIINGFYNFMEFSNIRTLRSMKTRLEKEPLNQMRDFWNMVGMPEMDNIDTEKLQEGLEWLANWNVEAELESLNADILILAGQNDPLLPIEKMKAHWQSYNLQICEGGGHALPVTNSQWCAEKIETFINGQ